MPRLRWSDFLIAVLIIALAFGLRAAVLTDRAYNDPLFQTLPDGSDQITYLSMASQYEAGTFPTTPFRYQPGFTYFLVGVQKLVGTNLVVDRLALALTDSLACGLMIGVGWLLTKRKGGGFLTGLLYAVYPVAIFYSAEPLLEGLALFYVCLFLFLTLWQRERLVVWRSVLIGVILGLETITRSNLALLLFAWLLWLWLIAPNRRQVIAHGAVSLIAMMLMIAPVTLWNVKEGSYQLVTNVGMDEIYRADNRDGDGTYLTPYNAHLTVDQDYAKALWDDIKRDPFHFIAIQVRKVGLYWSSAEPANNIDYYQDGIDVSPLLRAIPLNFLVLSALGLIGTAALWVEDRRAGGYFAAIHLLIFAGVMVIWVISRVRLPAVAPLVATSAYLPVWLWERRKSARWIRQIAPAVIAVAALLIFCAWAIDHALVKHPLTQIPADAHPGDIIFNKELKLAGWRWFDTWPSAANGWALTQQGYGVELFWQVLQPTDKDYSAYLAYLDNGTRYVADDAVIGTISRPPLPTSQWKPGEIYSEIMGFKFPDGVPLGQTGAIHLGVYLTNTNNFADPNRKIIGVPITSDPNAKTDLMLQSMAVFDPYGQPTALPDQTSSTLTFGDLIALKGYSLPTNNPPGSNATFEFHWQAIKDVGTDYILFVHVFDANNQLQAQYNAPVGGSLLSSNWRPGAPVEEQVSIQLPKTPGQYQVYMGLYDPVTKDRLTVDAPDDRPHLGEISISP